MANPLTDKIPMADAGVKIGLYCAQCGAKVQSNEAHSCAVNENETVQEKEKEK